MISIIVPTCRIGGLDVLFSGLSEQTEKGFELVLADSVFEWRGKIEPPPFDFQHIRVDVGFDKNEYCRMVNTAIETAKGDIILFLTDYTWLPERYLESHAEWHSTRDVLDCLTTPHRYSRCPPTSPDFPKYGQKDMAAYAEDLKSRRLEKLGFSIFEPPFGPADVEADPRHVVDIDADGRELIAGGPDPKDSMPEGSIQPNFIHLKGDSVKREILETVRSAPGSVFPMELDGGHGYQDTWFGLRTARAGARWSLSRKEPNWVPQVRDRFPRMPRTKMFTDQEALMRSLVNR